jgi:uncharacterized circularly permuted ATP-grasp superfamily protein
MMNANIRSQLLSAISQMRDFQNKAQITRLSGVERREYIEVSEKVADLRKQLWQEQKQMVLVPGMLARIEAEKNSKLLAEAKEVLS